MLAGDRGRNSVTSPSPDRGTESASLSQDTAISGMTLNKKQKKQIDVEQQKLAQLRLQLSGARKQLDDPAEVKRLEQEIAAAQARLEKLRAGG